MSRIVVLAIAIGIGTGHVYWAIATWPLDDMQVYLDAATRWRSGGDLYVSGDVGDHSFWYAPWFAALWVPLTFLPQEVVAVLWSAVLLVATALVIRSLMQMGRSGVVLALLLGPPLFAVTAGGNVHALMLLALLYGIPRSWGPLAIAAAASLKFAPFLFILIYVARREWGRATVTVVATAALVVPSVMLGLASAGARSEVAPSLFGVSPLLYLVIVAIASGLVLFVAGRYAPVAAATAVVLALPRLYVYDVTLLATGAVRANEPTTELDSD